MSQTPKGQIVRQLRQLWLRSRERAEALKNSKYSCQKCGVKKSAAKGKEQKIEVHHKNGIENWDAIVNLIYEQILCDPSKLECLCPVCHEKEDQENARKKVET